MATKKQKAEALYRMRQLTEAFDLNPNLVKYLEEGRVYYSYITGGGMFACVDTITYDPSYVEVIKNFQEESGGYVYHAIETNTKYGKMLTLLFVTPYEDNWKMERLTENYIYAYVYNFSDADGERGDVFLSSDNGALVRIG